MGRGFRQAQPPNVWVVRKQVRDGKERQARCVNWMPTEPNLRLTQKRHEPASVPATPTRKATSHIIWTKGV
jgi:hypothetical protein